MPATKVRGKSMADRFITDAQARYLLKIRCQGYGNLKPFADGVGIARCTVSNMVAGRRRICRRVAAGLGLYPFKGPKGIKGFVQPRGDVR